MLGWLFPCTCELCGEPSAEFVCESCLGKLPRISAPICLHCGAPASGQLAEADRCPECTGQTRTFSQARQALCHSSEAMQLIYAFKYHRALYLARALAGVLNELWEKTPHLTAHHHWTLVPVPVTSAKLYARGYNQAGELAAHLARMRGLPMRDLLCRRETGVLSQTRLTSAGRRLNAMRAYRCKSPDFFARNVSFPSHLVLVDDVFTTGATARACSYQLRKLAGVKEVVSLSLVRIGS